VKSLILNLGRDDKGQDLIEYGLLVGIITVAALVAIRSIGPKVAKFFSDLDAEL
jgi:pilus assembly protein Flp/PilA